MKINPSNGAYLKIRRLEIAQDLWRQQGQVSLDSKCFGPCYKCNICTYTKSRNILLKIGNMQSIRKAHVSVETTWQMNSTMHLMHQRKNRRKQYLSEKWDCDCWVHCSRYERIQFERALWIQFQRLSNLSIYINNLDAEKHNNDQLL